MHMTNEYVYTRKQKSSPPRMRNTSSPKPINQFLTPRIHLGLPHKHHEPQLRLNTPTLDLTFAFFLSIALATQYGSHPRTPLQTDSNGTNTTTQPTTSTDDWHLSSKFSIEHTPLYGILVTEKSFLIGTRSQVQKHHPHFLSHRIAGTGLPPELCDEIGEHLLTLLQNGATQLWKKMEHDPVAREARFSLGRNVSNTKSKLALGKLYNRIASCETADGTVKVRGSGVYVDILDGADVEECR
jgi:hypothetical protein